MSKTTDDLINRIEGAVTALKGVKAKLSPPAPPPPSPDAPPPQGDVSQEEYAHAKQVIAELKGNVEQLEAEVARDSKVPEPTSPGAPAPTAGGAEEHKSKSKNA
jgi:hypothetical protein